jgi:hypothetical protein
MTLADIKKHPNYPFKNFRDDNIEFLMLELYWAELFKEALEDEVIDSWVAELPADREDGNPILYVVNRKVNPPRIVRVIQRFNDECFPELNLNTFDPVHFENDAYVPYVPDISQGALDNDMITPVNELVISSSVSEVCEKYFRMHVGLWCIEFVDQKTMLAQLDDYWKKVNDSLIQESR